MGEKGRRATSAGSASGPTKLVWAALPGSQAGRVTGEREWAAPKEETERGKFQPRPALPFGIFQKILNPELNIGKFIVNSFGVQII